MENQNRRLLNKSIRQPENVIKISPANSVLHEIIKTMIVYILREKGKQVITEAEFESKGRADILNLTDGIIFEVLHSESMTYFQNKLLKYPGELEIEAIHTARFKTLPIEVVYANLKRKIDLIC